MQLDNLKCWSGILVGCLILIYCQKLLAVEVAGLYTAELQVISQSVEERKRLTSQGLRMVLQRVSGHPATIEHEMIKTALLNPDRYLRQYGYDSLNESPDRESPTDLQWLRLQFDEIQIGKLLRKAQLPIWGSNRPQILLWLTIDDESGRHTLGADNDSGLVKQIEREAQRRGLPVILPLMDLQDESALPVTEAWGLFRQTLETASARYQPEAILAGRLYRNDEQFWHGRWQFIFNHQVTGFSTSGDSENGEFDQVIDYVADTLARHYAVNTDISRREKIRVKVENILSLAAYAEMTEYFKKLAAVTRVSVAGVERDSIIIELTAEDSLPKLQEAIALDNKLFELSADPAGDKHDLVYRWQAQE